jgi:UDP-glucose 4-epimerase
MRIYAIRLERLSANILIIRHVQAALQGKNLMHLVNISSDAVYGDFENPIIERAALAPGSFHGIMHLMRETAINMQGGFPITHVRPTLIYGSDDPHNGYGPNRFMRQALAGEDIALFGKGEERRDHIFIGDVAEIVWRVIAHRATGAVNAATGQTRSFHALAELCIKLGQSSSKICYLERSGPMPHNGLRPFDVGNITRAFPDFRFTPIEDGLSQFRNTAKRRAA